MTSPMAHSKAQAGGDFIDSAVPAEARMPRFSLTMAWWALSTAAFFIVVAPLLAAGFGVGNVVAAMVASLVVFSLLSGPLTRYAIRTGASVSGMSQAIFGTGGAVVATFVLFATTVYYAVFEGAVVAVAASSLQPSLGLPVTSAIVVLYSILLALGPMQTWLDKLNGLLMPIYAIGLMVALWLAASKYGAEVTSQPRWTVDGAGFIACLAAYMGLWILPMCSFDYARFGRRSDMLYHSRFTFGWPFYLLTIVVNGLAGIYLVAVIPQEGAISEISIVQDIVKLMGVGGLVFLWATQTRINTANYYLASVNFAGLVGTVFNRRLPHVITTLIVGVVVYALMLANVISYLLTALAYQGIFVVAWVAIAAVHTLYDRARLDAPPVDAPVVRPAGLASWFLAVGCGAALRFAGPDVAVLSPIVTAALAAGTYAALLYAERYSLMRRDDFAGS